MNLFPFPFLMHNKLYRKKTLKFHSVTGIAVGNEIYTTDDETLKANLVPAMASMHAALVQLGLDSYIHISTATSLAVLENSFPPSMGAFKPELAPQMSQFLNFLAQTKAPFWINAYPYFAYKDDPNRIELNYVLFNPNYGMVDPHTHLHYDNMLYAQVYPHQLIGILRH
jgi:Glycosyl hydrolases family 17